MNETLKTIAERYTCRSFDGSPVSRELLEAIAMAGVQAPTAGNSQRFRLIVVDDKVLIDELETKLTEKLMANNPQYSARIKERGGKALYNASAIIFVPIEHTGPWPADLDAGIVVENMALAAHSLEVGNCINLMARSLFEGDDGQVWKDRLQFPPGFEFGIALLLGYPTDFGKAHEPDTEKIIWL